MTRVKRSLLPAPYVTTHVNSMVSLKLLQRIKWVLLRLQFPIVVLLVSNPTNLVF